MDIRAYIESGIIEEYVLGIATEEEVRELERLCAQYPEIQAAVEEAQETINNVSLKQPIEPPQELEDRIREALLNEGLIQKQHQLQAEEMKTDVDSSVYRYKRQRRTFAWLAAAAVLTLIAGAFYHLHTVRELKSEISSLTAYRQTLMANLANYQEELKKNQDALNITAKPSVLKLTLAGVEGKEGLSATLYWDRLSKELYLQPVNLPELPSEEQYQLWAIVDGKPISKGVYESNDGLRLARMIDADAAQLFAITVEKAGGVESPTLDRMVVAGEPTPAG